jgi:hypothetical protein
MSDRTIVRLAELGERKSSLCREWRNTAEAPMADVADKLAELLTA